MNRLSCINIRSSFSAYLDGAITGREMARIAAHLDTCGDCATEFHGWQQMQRALADLGPAQLPAELHSTLRHALAAERQRETHLTPARRISLAWQRWLAPMALRATAGLAATALIVGGLSYLFGPSIAVQANDERLAHLAAPHYLYSQVPPQPLETRHDVPIVIDAHVDARGRVYDYTIVEGPADAAARTVIVDNLLASVFRPATVFGVPVPGHILMTYSGVSVHG
jgi:anti-sigma factor RsiW